MRAFAYSLGKTPLSDLLRFSLTAFDQFYGTFMASCVLATVTSV